MKKVLNRKCKLCWGIFPVIAEDDFFSKTSKNLNKYMVRGVRWVEDPFASDIYDDKTKGWECNLRWWENWWEI